MPTSNYDAFERWLDGILFGTNVTYNHKTNTMTVKNPMSPFEIQSVLSNRRKNAFTVVWADGTHTTVHCQSGDEWDDEKALAMCFTKKALGNKGNFNDKFNDALDNKMKVIPEEKKVIPAKEVCNCDGKRDHGIHSCTECKCKEESEVDKALAKEFVKKSVEKATVTCGINKQQPLEGAQIGNAFGINTQTATELSKAALKASNSFTEMIEALANDTKKTEGEPEPAHTYKIYIKVSGESLFDSNKYSIESLRERVHEIATELYGGRPYYYRTWMNGNRMTIDFGHYTQFIEVEGITPSEYAKN